jgi:hypothetical protein
MHLAHACIQEPSGEIKTLKRTFISLLFCTLLASCAAFLARCGGSGGTTTGTPQQPQLVSIAVTPAIPSLTKGQTLQFKATGTYSDNSTLDITASAAWNSSNTGVATILSGGSGGGLATAVGAGTTTIQASVNGVSGSTTLTVTAFAGVLSYHNDSARTGQNLDETVLTPSNVNVNTFGKLFSVPVDGYVYAQPLYVPEVSIPSKGVHNVVYVATENDTVYGFDADAGGAPLWQTSLLGPGETAVPATDLPNGCNFVVPVIGITSTPVIDSSTNTIYVVAMSKLVSGSSTTYFQRLHALDITTGTERTGSPVAISGTAPGTQTAFNPFMHLSRPGLALAGGAVYVAFGSHCDVQPYHGWLFAYNAAQLTQLAVFNTTPGGTEGAIWQAGGAPSSDATGNIYVITGNGTFDADSGGSDYGQSFLKLSLSGNTLAVDDYFSPFNQADLNSTDQDLGSAGALLLPDSVGSATHPHLMISAGKGGTIYLVDRDNLGKYCGSCTSTDTQIVQEVPGAISENFSNPAYWQGLVYFGASNDSLRAFSISNGVLSSSSVSASLNTFGERGTTPSISANGSTNGIVWVIGSQAGTPVALLHAYLGTNLADERYNSAQASNGRDTAGYAVKFTVPTIANGKVYIGTQTELDVYGLLP